MIFDRTYSSVAWFCSVSMLLVFVACQRNEPMAQTSALEQKQKNNTLLATKLFEHFNRHDWKSMAQLYSDSAMFQDPSLGDTAIHQSHQQIIDKYTALHKDIPDLRDSIVAMYPSGDNIVAIEFISSGTLPDGSRMKLPICAILTISTTGTIVRDHTYYDNMP